MLHELLAVSHKSKRCHSSDYCYSCKQKHHSLLQRTESFTREKPSAETITVIPFSPNRSLEIPGLPRKSEIMTSSTVLLCTAEVNIKLNNAIISERALIDPAFQATFISRGLQRKLDRPMYSAAAVTIVGLNCTNVVANSRNVCIVSLRSPLSDRLN